MNNIKTTNGRIDIQTPSTKNLFALYDKIPANQCATYMNATEGLWDNTQLSDMFFSQKNIQILQNGIRAGVYEKSNRQYVVGPQDCDSLKIIMRSIFLQYAANQPTNIRNQIQQLNQFVLNYSIQQVYSEAQGYMKYISDASTMYIPMTPPIMSKNSDKELVLKPWF